MSKDKDPIDNFLEKQKAEREAELDDLKKKKPVTNLDKSTVEQSLRDKSVLDQAAFTEVGKKEAGVTQGYIAKDEQGNTFILKQFPKDEKHANSHQDLENRRDNVQELVTGTMYQFLLYDRAPKIELVRSGDANENSLYIRSKFFADVVSLTQFSFPGKKELKNGDFNANNRDLKKVEGFEKVIAACHMLGEADYHASNLMVQNIKEKNEKGETIEISRLTKIDHGRSFMRTFDSFEEMAKTTYSTFEACNYAGAIRNGNLSLNAKAYAESLNSMVKQLSDDQIDKIVDSKIDELKKAGFEPKGLSIRTSDNKDVYVASFDELRNEYKNIAKSNRENMKKIAQAAEIIDKLDVDDKFKNGLWLEKLGETPPSPRHPVQYAIRNNIKIDGQDPVRWAMKKENFGKLPKNVQTEAKLNKPIDLAVKQSISKKTGQLIGRIGGLIPDIVKQELKGANAHVDKDQAKGGNLHPNDTLKTNKARGKGQGYQH